MYHNKTHTPSCPSTSACRESYDDSTHGSYKHSHINEAVLHTSYSRTPLDAHCFSVNTDKNPCKIWVGSPDSTYWFNISRPRSKNFLGSNAWLEWNSQITISFGKDLKLTFDTSNIATAVTFGNAGFSEDNSTPTLYKQTNQTRYNRTGDSFTYV